MKIGLAEYNDIRALAFLETPNDTVEVCLARNPKTACAGAARVLRRMADKFDALAKEEDPFHTQTQSRVNRGKSGGAK